MRLRIKLLVITLICVCTFSLLCAQKTATVSSPDNSILLKVRHGEDNKILYSLSLNGKNIILPSGIGFSLSKPAVELNRFAIVSADTTIFNETWKPVWGEVSTIRNNYKELVLKLKDKSNAGILLNVIFRVFNDGMGFRYEFPKQAGLNYFIVAEEKTQFAMAGDHKTFWIPGDYDTNEYPYNTTKLSEVDAVAAAKKEKDIAVTSPIGANAVQTPLMMKTTDGFYINIHEAALVNYPAMNLVLDKKTRTLQSHLVPDAVGNKAYLQAPAKTPWRTIIVSSRATDILASKTILNLNEPSKIGDEGWIKPQKFIGMWWEMHIGKANWPREGGKHGANTQNVKTYIDFAAKYGFDGVLVEGWNEGWEDWFGNWKEEVFDFITPYPDFNLKEVNDYAKSKGIKMIMHHETSGSVANYERHLDRAFDMMQRYGYPAVKSGYVGKIIPRGEFHDGQTMVNHFNFTARRAADYKLMINSHESSRPTGYSRTYPNYIASEAARGNEFNAWSNGNPPMHETILPFTRLLGGPMDYTPGIFEIKMNVYDKTKTAQVHTTLAKQLALYITMYSPLQMAADLPENYEKYPDAFQFIKDVAADWDESKYLEAEPGDYLTIARKAKATENWFVGAITDENPRNTEIKLDFLTPGKKYKAIIYQDGKTAHWKNNPINYEIKTIEVTSKSKLKLILAAGGGTAISIMPI